MLLALPEPLTVQNCRMKRYPPPAWRRLSNKAGYILHTDIYWLHCAIASSYGSYGSVWWCSVAAVSDSLTHWWCSAAANFEIRETLTNFVAFLLRGTYCLNAWIRKSKLSGTHVVSCCFIFAIVSFLSATLRSWVMPCVLCSMRLQSCKLWNDKCCDRTWHFLSCPSRFCFWTDFAIGYNWPISKSGWAQRIAVRSWWQQNCSIAQWTLDTKLAIHTSRRHLTRRDFQKHRDDNASFEHILNWLAWYSNDSRSVVWRGSQILQRGWSLNVPYKPR